MGQTEGRQILASNLARLRSPAAVQAALDELTKLGRTAFLERYGFGKSRDYLVRNPHAGEQTDLELHGSGQAHAAGIACFDVVCVLVCPISFVGDVLHSQTKCRVVPINRGVIAGADIENGIST